MRSCLRAAVFSCATVIVAALAGVGVSAQVPTIQSLRTGTGSISGRVMDAQSGEPLANVMLTLTAPKVQGGSLITTDIEGYYQFSKLAEHDYHIVIFDPLYLRACHGATDVEQMQCGAVTVSRDQHRTGIDLRATLSAIIRGRVVDENGRAVGRAMVRASNASSTLPAAVFSNAQTKPDGTFELQGLTGGDTILTLEMPATLDTPRPPTVFYPGVLAAEDAQAIRVTGGLVTSAITFRYPKIANRALRVRVSAPASGATGIKAWLYRIEPRMTRAIPLDADGAGTIGSLIEGRYFIAAQGEIDSEPLATFEVVDLRENATEVALLLQEPGRITGKIIAERGDLPPLSEVRVATQWIDDDGLEIDPVAVNEIAIAADGSFRIHGLFGSRRVNVIGLPPEWQVQSIRQGRTEIPATGVTIAPGSTLDIVVRIVRR